MPIRVGNRVTRFRISRRREDSFWETSMADFRVIQARIQAILGLDSFLSAILKGVNDTE